MQLIPITPLVGSNNLLLLAGPGDGERGLEAWSATERAAQATPNSCKVVERQASGREPARRK